MDTGPSMKDPNIYKKGLKKLVLEMKRDLSTVSLL